MFLNFFIKFYYDIDQNKKNSKKLFFICIKKRLKYKNKFKKYKSIEVFKQNKNVKMENDIIKKIV